MNALCLLSASALARMLADGEISSAELTEACLAAAEEKDPSLGAYLTVCADTAMADARRIDERRKTEALPSLAGIPVAVKDNICTRGVRTTCASRMLENFVPPYDAFAVRKLRQAGAVLIGKTNMDEFAMGSTTERSAFFPCRNPHDPTRVPGGSSGGSAAAVGAHLVPLALGSDTGGSVRQPAAFCGAVGLRPTYGAVSRSGLISFAPSLDQIGPIAATVRDCKLLFDAICGHDGADAQSLPDTDPVCDTRPLSALRVGLWTDGCGAAVDPAVLSAVRQAARRLEALGCAVEEITIPELRCGLAAYHVTADVEAASNLGRFDGIRYGLRADADTTEDLYRLTRADGFGSELKRRILFGTYALSLEARGTLYDRASSWRECVRRTMRALFSRFDLLLSPVTPDLPPHLGERADVIDMYRSDAFVVPASLAGLPALSVPFGATPEGLPIGVQLTAGALREDLLFRCAQALETGEEAHA